MDKIPASLDMETLNSLPVSRRAREMLERAGLKPDKGCFHCIQLVLWGINRAETEVDQSVLETLQAMASWRPERIANFLKLAENDFLYDPPGWKEAQAPEWLARIILEEMEKRMMFLFPWYGHLE
jgi:hypothetical protein